MTKPVRCEDKSSSFRRPGLLAAAAATVLFAAMPACLAYDSLTFRGGL